MRTKCPKDTRVKLQRKLYQIYAREQSKPAPRIQKEPRRLGPSTRMVNPYLYMIDLLIKMTFYRMHWSSYKSRDLFSKWLRKRLVQLL